jgi:hypothetical protein
LPTITTRPSAADSAERVSPRMLRVGSRKNCSTKTSSSQNGIDHQPSSHVASTANPSVTKTWGQPSRAMMVWEDITSG